MNSYRLLYIVLLVVLSVGMNVWASELSDETKARMAQFAWIEGNWTGEAVFPGTGGEENETMQMTQNASFALDGMVLVFDGVGRKDGEIVHHVYATITYDARQERYVMSAMTMEGNFTTPVFNANADGMRWQMKIEQRHLRFNIENKDGSWHETGEISTDGENWNKFFDMTLTK